jgi:hypothetical protein
MAQAERLRKVMPELSLNQRSQKYTPTSSMLIWRNRSGIKTGRAKHELPVPWEKLTTGSMLATRLCPASRLGAAGYSSPAARNKWVNVAWQQQHPPLVGGERGLLLSPATGSFFSPRVKTKRHRAALRVAFGLATARSRFSFPRMFGRRSSLLWGTFRLKSDISRGP